LYGVEAAKKIIFVITGQILNTANNSNSHK